MLPKSFHLEPIDLNLQPNPKVSAAIDAEDQKKIRISVGVSVVPVLPVGAVNPR